MSAGAGRAADHRLDTGCLEQRRIHPGRVDDVASGPSQDRAGRPVHGANDGRIRGYLKRVADEEGSQGGAGAPYTPGRLPDWKPGK